MLLAIKIKQVDSPAFPDVYNLAFGPQNEEGGISDSVNLNHKEPDRLFATIISFALAFLDKNPNVTIGLDGSDDVRAYMYHRMFIANRHYLSRYLQTFGVDWFVRLLRNGDMECDGYNRLLFKPKAEVFDYQRPGRDLYRYYMFRLSKPRTSYNKLYDKHGK